MKRKTKPADEKKTQESQDAGFPIVGLGASAGGLEAFEQFFRHVPSDCGIAFVLVSHLDPGHASMLTEILQRATGMPVVEAGDQMKVFPGHVYVIPPNRDMAIFHGALQLSVPEASRGLRMPIDFFFRSLAEEQGEKSICVILSGTGTDGTLGLRAVHGAGGGSFVQDPTSARYDGMPVSAVKSGLAMYVLPIEKLPEQLMIYVKTLFKKKVRPAPSAPAVAGSLSRIMMLLRSKTGHDFSLYRQNTIRRRIERRMIMHCIEKMDAYARYLHEHPEEVQLLFRELLINVTSFFRDPEAFAALKKDILPQLFANKPENYVFRIWVPACASGEEAYSIAIIFREYMDDLKQEFKVQIYSTDIDEEAIATARSGIYPPNIAMDMSAERLKRFFVQEEKGYRVKKGIREMIVFAAQDVVKDPPFTRVDMVSCRNLLIYLEPELQGRLIRTFNYALKPGGILFLSPSESVGSYTDLFAPINRKWKFFEAKVFASSMRKAMAGGFPLTGDHTEKGLEEAVKKAGEMNFAEITKKVLIQSYAPPSVITDAAGNILYIHGETGKYLRPAPGQARLNVIEMAREEVQLELRKAVQSAVTQKTKTVHKDLLVKTNGGKRGVKLTVRPLTDLDTTQELFIVSFEEKGIKAKGKPPRAEKSGARSGSGRVVELKAELLYTKENLEATIEELQASNEELKSTNEELQSTNEELQSTNEELETSKEELQSVNEEIVTVNAELQSKIEQLTGMENDLKNLFDTTNVGIVFLDENLIIKRFTKEAAKVFRLVASDVGRPLSDIKSNIENEDLITEARAVLDSLVPLEKNVQTADDAWLLVRIVPYRTLDNVIDGVVLTFADITSMKKAEQESQAAREYAEGIVNTIREPLVVLDHAMKVVSASRSFYDIFQVSPRETIGCRIYELGNGQWNIPKLRELLEDILPHDFSFENMEVEHDFPVIGRKKMLLNARRILEKTGGTQLILLAIEDVTGKGSK